MLHSFYYTEAVKAFSHVTEVDPSCAMGHWGVAMSWWYPLWYPPSEAALTQGKAAAEKAAALKLKTDRERDYIAAIGSFYQNYEAVAHATRTLAYEKAMEGLYLRYPDDHEAAAFYALALQANIDPADKTYAKQLKSAAILEQLFAEQPRHPGVAHYLIHAYDYPGLADKGLDAARRYGKIAPAVPHALHMPSHTFTYLGLWAESIDSNTASAAAARKLGDPVAELHALDYLMYAYLQRSQGNAARGVLEALTSVPWDETGRTLTTDYALSAIPARYAIERRKWAEAANLATRSSRFLATEANTHFARGLGATHIGKRDDARREIEQLVTLQGSLEQAKQDYWAKQVRVQWETVSAWLALAEGNAEESLGLMRKAADLEDTIYRHSVSPGRVVPARELLGDLLLQMQRPDEALAEYERSLRDNPLRFNGVYGAARSAELAGNREKAGTYYGQLGRLAQQSDEDRPELEAARTFIQKM
jgi:hypothetical protein